MCKTHGHIKSLENLLSRINCHEQIKYLPRPKFGCYYFPTKYWATEDEENFEVVKLNVMNKIEMLSSIIQKYTTTAV